MSYEARVLWAFRVHVAHATSEVSSGTVTVASAERELIDSARELYRNLSAGHKQRLGECP